MGETYLGILMFRFYFKCTNFSAEIIMKTDPQNSDYVVESGASRNFEPWRGEANEEEKRKRDAEEMGDAMKSLKIRTLDSKREMDILAALDEMKSMKSRHANVSVDAMLEALQPNEEEEEDRLVEEDEALIKSIFQGSRKFVKRIRDEDDEDLIEDSTSGKSSSNNSSKRKKVSVNPTDHLTKLSSTVRVSFVKKIIVASNGSRHEKENKHGEQKTNIEDSKQENKTNITTNGLQPLCQHYESDGDD